MHRDIQIIRDTESVCPKCLKKIKAIIAEKQNRVYMIKECELHGAYEILLSRHVWYYRGLSDLYFSLMGENFPQRDYMIRLTNRCNMNCPICLVNANTITTDDYSLEDLEKFLKDKRNLKIGLMGGEPTVREDLPEIISKINNSGNMAILHTNGIKIADFNYLSRLKDTGLEKVHLQFDGFDDDVYQKLRGSKLLEVKLKTLDNLKRLNIATNLTVTIMRNVNENQMQKILEFGIKNYFIKEIFFLGCRFLGNAKNFSYKECLMPDELIDVLEEQTNAKINRKAVYDFQKLYFDLLALFSIRKCFYIHQFLIVRNNKDYISIDKLVDLNEIHKKIERLKHLIFPNKKLALCYLFLNLLPEVIFAKNKFLLKDFFIPRLLYALGINSRKYSQRVILLGFLSTCDAYNFDYQIAQYCGKGAISTELGIQDAEAIDNIMREDLLCCGY